MVKLVNLEQDLVKVCCSPRRRKHVFDVVCRLREGKLTSPGSSLEGIQHILSQPDHHLLALLTTEAEVGDCGGIHILDPHFFVASERDEVDELNEDDQVMFAKMYELFKLHVKRVHPGVISDVNVKKLQLSKDVVAGILLYTVQGQQQPQQLLFLEPQVQEKEGLTLVAMAMDRYIEEDDDSTDE